MGERLLSFASLWCALAVGGHAFGSLLSVHKGVKRDGSFGHWEAGVNDFRQLTLQCSS